MLNGIVQEMNKGVKPLDEIVKWNIGIGHYKLLDYPMKGKITEMEDVTSMSIGLLGGSTHPKYVGITFYNETIGSEDYFRVPRKENKLINGLFEYFREGKTIILEGKKTYMRPTGLFRLIAGVGLSLSLPSYEGVIKVDDEKYKFYSKPGYFRISPVNLSFYLIIFLLIAQNGFIPRL